MALMICEIDKSKLLKKLFKKSKTNDIKKWIKKEMKIKYVQAKDFFQLKFLGKRHFLHFSDKPPLTFNNLTLIAHNA